MRRMLALGALTLAMGCSASTGPDVEAEASLIDAPVEVTVAYGQEVQVEGSTLRVSLTGVPDDSRCPQDVTCVWAGNAVVEVRLAAGAASTVLLQMNTTLEPHTARWDDLQVTLLELRPTPVSTTPIRMEDYEVTVRLEPVM